MYRTTPFCRALDSAGARLHRSIFSENYERFSVCWSAGGGTETFSTKSGCSGRSEETEGAQKQAGNALSWPEKGTGRSAGLGKGPRERGTRDNATLEVCLALPFYSPSRWSSPPHFPSSPLPSHTLLPPSCTPSTRSSSSSSLSSPSRTHSRWVTGTFAVHVLTTHVLLLSLPSSLHRPQHRPQNPPRSPP